MSTPLPDIEPAPLPAAPPNLSALAAGSFADGVHVRLKLNLDVTHLSEDRQKLLLHWVSQGAKQMESTINVMGSIEVAKRLAQLERINEFRSKADNNSNGTPA